MRWKQRLAGAPIRALDAVGATWRPAVPVAYVVEREEWSIKWDGTYICRGIEAIAPGTMRVVTRPERLARQVVHFGSQFQWCAWAEALPRSNRYVVTYFHGKPEDGPELARHVDAFLRLVPRADKIVTAAALVEQRLLAWGVPREKLVRIPIGVDLSLFRPADSELRAAVRARYGVAKDQLVIGSFQKDGVGFGEGLQPKSIKAPDVLLDVVARVARERPVFVLLTGPARGFVKQGLERLGVPYAHDYVEDYLTLPERYAALDVYLNPSHEEGGPKGVIESMASGVPVVSTRVGMAPDLIVHGQSGWLAEPGDVEGLARAVLLSSADGGGRAKLVLAARGAVQVCDWSSVARRHYEEVYRPMLDAKPEASVA